jgi:hypothetical protein
MALWLETPFSRHYNSQNGKQGTIVSRFLDASGSMTAADLRREWVAWTDGQREDFCQSCCWLYEQADFADMLRFIMGHGRPQAWSAIATLIAAYLPQEEAFQFLLGALRSTDIGNASNAIQGLALTKHSDAEAAIRKRLQEVWTSPKLWVDDYFLNWVASEAEKCIQYPIELGASPADFEEQVRRLSEHVCRGNRESCRRWLSKHYSWLQ